MSSKKWDSCFGLSSRDTRCVAEKTIGILFHRAGVESRTTIPNRPRTIRGHRGRYLPSRFEGPGSATMSSWPIDLARAVQIAPMSAGTYFDLRLKLIALHRQPRDSGVPRGVTCTQDSQVLKRRHARSA